MKKTAILVFLAMIFLAQKGFCDTTAKQEVIKLDTIPVLEVNQHSTPKIIDTNKVYYDSLIAPAQEQNPALNFNLNNIKNIKKGAILPNDNVNQTMTNITQYFNAPYDKVFSHLLGIVDSSELEVVSYDSTSGRIYANYNNQKPVYITVSQYNSSNVLVKITPADGIYDIPPSLTSKIFSELNRSLATK